jgi:endoglycosylceramidase
MLARVTISFPRSSALTVLLGALAACGESDPGAGVPPERVIEAPKLATRRLVTRSGALIDDLGRKVILRGVNVGGRSKMPPFVPFDIQSSAEVPARAEQIMTAVQKLGSNGVRLTLSWEALEPQRGVYDDAYIARYRALLDAADKAGLSVIIDFHQDVFQAAFCGDGFPEWALGDIPHGPPHYDCSNFGWSQPYFNPMSEVSRAFDGLWNNRDGLLDALVGMWSRVAREFGRHPAVAAFEVMNEPGSGSLTPEVLGATVLPAVYDRVAAAIEAEVGPAAVLGDDPIATINSVERLVRPTHARFTYGPHFYDILVSIGGPVDADRIRSEVSAILARAEAWGAPVVIGEYGTSNAHAQKAEFSTAVLDAADARRASAMAWEASMSDVLWNNEDFSVLMTDGSPRAWGDALDRPVARAIDGTILDLSWNAAGKHFELSVEGNTDKVSEVYLPQRHFGGLPPQIKVTGARFRWMPETSVVLVAAERGASWSLVADNPLHE